MTTAICDDDDENLDDHPGRRDFDGLEDLDQLPVDPDDLDPWDDWDLTAGDPPDEPEFDGDLWDEDL